MVLYRIKKSLQLKLYTLFVVSMLSPLLLMNIFDDSELNMCCVSVSAEVFSQHIIMCLTYLTELIHYLSF